MLEDVAHLGTREAQQVAEVHSIARSTVYAWQRQRLYEGIMEPQRKRTPKGFSCIPPEDMTVALRALDEWPLYYLDELCTIVFEATGHQYHWKQMSKALLRRGYTHKKLEYRAMEQSRPLRLLYRANVRRYYSAHQLVFFDESHVKPEDVRRKYGISRKGRPAFFYIRHHVHGDVPPVSAICAMGLQGTLSVTTSAANITAERILDILENNVLPMMRPFPQTNSVLVLDNARVHQALEIEYLCQRFGVRVLFLPPYSYDFNPIELAFHQAKSYIRRRYGRHPGAGTYCTI